MLINKLSKYVVVNKFVRTILHLQIFQILPKGFQSMNYSFQESEYAGTINPDQPCLRRIPKTNNY
ncbi:MAG: hypothetical protein EA361_03605 [Bacteroidetes bacterium]|nr:MAG: hypothetical protein EA361_03605 [Bacteroidota bacterium]